MGSELDLFEARVSYLYAGDNVAEIHFSYVCIHKFVSGRDTGNSWSQEAVLVLQEARWRKPLPSLPNAVADGYLEVDDMRYELIPLPFERIASARLHLEFNDGSVLDVEGRNPLIKLLGEKVFL